MRTTVGILGGITILFVGFIALSEAAQQSRSTAMNSSASSTAWNTTTDVLGGIGQASGPAVVFMGIGAIVLVALGILAVSGRRGGR